MTSADRFLSAFNDLEKYCRRQLGADKHESMTAMLYQLQKSNAVIRNYLDELRDFAQLRNAIVHSRKGDEIIAYPAEYAVKEIEIIRDKILHPPIVKSLFGKKVITASQEDNLKTVLALFSRFDISQVPITKDGDVIEIVNGNTITRWLANQDIVSPQDHRISELLPSIERKKNFAFVSDKTDIYTCADLYSSSLHKGWYFDAILLTHSGRIGEGLTGIAVLDDIAPYMS